jgi:predicted nucleic acid-binding Zn finger protein
MPALGQETPAEQQKVQLYELAEAVFDLIAAENAQDTEGKFKVSNEQLSSLFELFDITFQRALEIVDAKALQIVTTDPGTSEVAQRCAFKVQGSAQFPYIAMGHYCTCKAFASSVLYSNQLYCKHQLAARLSLCGSVTLRQSLTRVIPTEKFWFAIRDNNRLVQ